MSEGFALRPVDMESARSAIDRNGGHVGRMSEYCVRLRPGDGAFSPIAGRFEEAYRRTVETQISVLGQMRDKLGAVAAAVDASREAYQSCEDANATLVREVARKLTTVHTEIKVG